MLYISKFKINYLFIYFWNSISILHSDELVNFPPKYFLLDFEPRNNRIVHLFHSDPQEWDEKLMPPEPLIYGWRTDTQKFRRSKFQTVSSRSFVCAMSRSVDESAGAVLASNGFRAAR